MPIKTFNIAGLNETEQRKSINLAYGADFPQPWPRTQEEQYKIFGGLPWDLDYESKHIAPLDLRPYGFEAKEEILEVHRLLLPVFESALQEIGKFRRENGYPIRMIAGYFYRYVGGPNTEKLRLSPDKEAALTYWRGLENQPNRPRRWEHGFNWDSPTGYSMVLAYYHRDRQKLQPDQMSKHAWGSAIDINWDKNGLKAREFDMPVGIVEIMRRHGFAWGGYYKGEYNDPMHFDYRRMTIDARRVCFPLVTAGLPQHAPAYFARNERGLPAKGSAGGYFPVTLHGCLHGGAHIDAGERVPVRAILPGYVVAARFIPPGATGDTPVLRAFMGDRPPNFVLLRHELVDPDVTDDAHPLVLYSLYMHLDPPDWSAPLADPVKDELEGSAPEAKPAKRKPAGTAPVSAPVITEPSQAGWVQSFLKYRYGSVVNVDPAYEDGKSLAKVFWSLAKLEEHASEYPVLGAPRLPAGDAAKPKAVAKPTPANIARAIDGFRVGSVVTLPKPLLPVQGGEVIGIVKGDLHFEIFSPGDAPGLGELLKKLPDLEKLIHKVQEKAGGENNYLDAGEAESLLCQPASTVAGTGLAGANTTEQVELQKVFKGQSYGNSLTTFMNEAVFALPKAKDHFVPDAAQPPEQPVYWLTLSLDNSHKYAGRTDKRPIKVQCSFFCGDTPLGKAVLEITNTNQPEYTVQVPARADRMVLASEDIFLDETPTTNPAGASLALCQQLLPLHWRGLLLNHENEWTAEGLDRLLQEFQQKKKGAIEHLTDLLKADNGSGAAALGTGLEALKACLRPAAWWNRKRTHQDPFGEVSIFGEGPANSLFGTGSHQLPPTGKVKCLHPVTATWLIDLAARDRKISPRDAWPLTDLEGAPNAPEEALYLSFVGLEADATPGTRCEVAVGQRLLAVLVLKGYGTYEGGSWQLKRDTQAEPTAFAKVNVIEGAAWVEVPTCRWGIWELSAKDVHGKQLSPRQAPFLKLHAAKPEAAGQLRMFSIPGSQASWVWAGFTGKPKAPQAIQGLVTLQFVKTTGDKPAADATWQYAKMAIPVVAMHVADTSAAVGGLTVQGGFVVKAEKNARVSEHFTFADYAAKGKDRKHFKVSLALCLRIEEFATLLGLAVGIVEVAADGLAVTLALKTTTSANRTKLKDTASSSALPPLAAISHTVDEKQARITFTQQADDLSDFFFNVEPSSVFARVIKNASIQPSDTVYFRLGLLVPNGGHSVVDLKPPADEPHAVAFDRDALLKKCGGDVLELAGPIVGPFRNSQVEFAFKMTSQQLVVEARLIGDMDRWKQAAPQLALDVPGAKQRTDGALVNGVLRAAWSLTPDLKADPKRWGKELAFSVVLGKEDAFPVPPANLKAAPFRAVPELLSLQVVPTAQSADSKVLELVGQARCVPPDKDLRIRCETLKGETWETSQTATGTIQYGRPAATLAAYRPGGLCDESGRFLAYLPRAALDPPYDEKQWRFRWYRELTKGKIHGLPDGETTLQVVSVPGASQGSPTSPAPENQHPIQVTSVPAAGKGAPATAAPAAPAPATPPPPVALPTRPESETTSRAVSLPPGAEDMSYAAKPGTGADILVVFAGRSLELPACEAWADALWAAAFPTVGHRFAVRGPKADPADRNYDKYARFPLLTDMLLGLVQGPSSAQTVYVVAHSSGTGMARYWFTYSPEKHQDPKLLYGRVVYYNLDGFGGKVGKEDAGVLQKFCKEAYAVRAFCKGRGQTHLSRNALAMSQLGTSLKNLGLGDLIPVDQSHLLDGVHAAMKQDDAVWQDEIKKWEAEKQQAEGSTTKQKPKPELGTTREGMYLHLSLVNSRKEDLGKGTEHVYTSCTKESVEIRYLKHK